MIARQGWLQTEREENKKALQILDVWVMKVCGPSIVRSSDFYL